MGNCVTSSALYKFMSEEEIQEDKKLGIFTGDDLNSLLSHFNTMKTEEFKYVRSNTGHITYQFTNWQLQGKYKGSLHMNIPHGHGIMYYETSSNADEYEGCFYYGKKHGSGTIEYYRRRYTEDSSNSANGEWSSSYTGEYKGEWYNDMRHGKGQYKSRCGDTYNGSWKYDKYHGYGVFETFTKDLRYEGEWFQGKKHGQGKQTTNKGYIYEGNWDKGAKHGYGKLYKNNKLLCEGSWDNDKFTGDMIKYMPNGVYTGQILQNLRHGSGSMKLNNGYEFKGNWHNDKFTGHGQIEINGGTYTGDIENDLPHGKGKFIHDKCVCEDGTWDNGKFTGVGQLKINHNIYTGEIKNNLPNGKGKMVYYEYVCENGTWDNGKFTGVGQLKMEHGVYDGEIKDNLPCGKGTLEYNHTTCVGDWDKGTCKNAVFTTKNSVFKGTIINYKYYSEGTETRLEYSRTGKWERNKFTGNGAYKYEQCVYDGAWVDEYAHGHGTLTFDDGSSYTGVWDHDVPTSPGLFVKEKSSYNGEFYFENKETSIWKLKSIKQFPCVHGMGKLIQDDNIYEGLFDHGIFLNGSMTQYIHLPHSEQKQIKAIKYTGEFKNNNLVSGDKILFYNDGTNVRQNSKGDIIYDAKDYEAMQDKMNIMMEQITMLEKLVNRSIDTSQ